MANLGEQVGEGRTSVVYEYGPGAVVKVPKPHIPDEWAELEARHTAEVHAVGGPAPAVHDVVEAQGRTALVLQRIDGQPLWDLMRRNPKDEAYWMAALAALQRRIHRLDLPPSLPDLVGRMRSKVQSLRPLSEPERVAALDLVDQLPRGAAVLHGDLHPGNVIVTDKGLVAIDWFDVSIGHPMADAVRTSLLIRPVPGSAVVHLPGADVLTLDTMQRYHQAEFPECDWTGARWWAAIALSRLTEAAEVHERDLWALGRRYAADPAARRQSLSGGSR
ncbi:MAG: phosphotransferase [Actinomycetota bacterium]